MKKKPLMSADARRGLPQILVLTFVAASLGEWGFRPGANIHKLFAILATASPRAWQFVYSLALAATHSPEWKIEGRIASGHHTTRRLRTICSHNSSKRRRSRVAFGRS